jgi:hypothetical protein
MVSKHLTWEELGKLSFEEQKWVCKQQVPGKNLLCGADAEERYSLGIYAGRYCDACWRKSGYRTEGPEGFDPLDAGESYEPV